MEKVNTFLSLCLENELTEVCNLLTNGIPVDAQDAEGTTGLQIAATNGYKKLAEHLVEQGADVNLTNNCGWTPLMHAAQHGQVSVVTLLLNYGATVNATSLLGAGALTLAAAGGHHSTVCLLLEAGTDIATSAGHSGPRLAPLAAAAINGHVSIVGVLLQRGTSVNQVLLATGTTPLMLAASGGHLRVAQMLKDHGADPNQQDFYGKTALDVATACSNMEVAEYLRSMTQLMSNQEYNPTITDIFKAIAEGNLRDLKRILKEHPSCTNWCHLKKGTTPLMHAAILGCMDAVTLLVKNNADLEMQDYSAGWTVLMHAVYHGHVNIVRYLISSGADVCVEAFNGATALDIACYHENGDAKIIRMLADQTVARMSTPTGNVRKQSDSQHLKALKGWIGNVTQKLTPWKGRQLVQKSVSQAANLPSSLALDLQSLSVLPKHNTMPALDISFTSPEITFPEVDTVFRAALPSLPNYEKMLEATPAAMPDNFTQAHSQKITRRAIEPKFLRHLKPPPCIKPEPPGVMSILQQLGLDKYAENFEENEVDWDAFVNLDSKSIEEIGVKTEANREALREAINQLQKM
ncbi:ankyrin repeat and SAM domain-containing protein 6-like isoform X1 [Dermacentor andersoni]|uniref:ankyrin repeat and SAM domain-containing protein 6-like isoform X1 n=2 Tax=Dermacentor andersoni TaxID=34620 RepID=UPI002155F5B2|nr:ankyrin repeat and SAM domain-containing protein 6-like isoform X1 [Dermacentor andersoni]